MSWRLFVRPEAERDLGAARDWYDHRRSGLGEGFLDEVTLAMMAGMAEAWIGTHQGAFDREQGAIGLTGMVKGHQAELGYWIGKPFWREGYCTEAARAILRYAFTELALVRVHATHITRNPASGRIMQKIGMRHEGRRRHHVKKWDQLDDVELYGIVRQDWDEGAGVTVAKRAATTPAP